MMGVAELSNIGMATAFAAGVISFLSPCVLPLVPGYVSFVSGAALGEGGRAAGGRLSIVPPALCFVVGFSTVFIALGASATAISHLLLQYRTEANLAGGATVMLFGAFMTGLIPMPWLQRDLRFHGGVSSGRPVMSAYVLGLAFGFGWTPCIGPVLGAILTISALSATAAAGVTLLGVYSLGLGLPFLAAAMFTDALLRRRGEIGKAGRLLRVGTGAVMIAMGAAMITGTMTTVSFWLLDTFPWLSTIG
jgi:cytochrome c-type biogenesis protein